MASTGPSPRRVQIAVFSVAALVAGVGAAIWSRTVASGDDDTIRFDRAAAASAVPDPLTPGHDGEPFRAVTVLDADGDPLTLDSDGRPMVVNFWNSTCAPCSRELKWFGALAAELGDEVRFVGVNSLDSQSRMVEFAADRGVHYELYRDDDYAASDAYELIELPVTLFVAADGTIVGQANELTDRELRAQVAAISG